MNGVVLLDAGPLGLVTNPRRSPQSVACARWLGKASAAGARIVVPEIADYEVRRELLRAKKARGLAYLDALIGKVSYLPITTEAMRRAAEFWAQTRQHGRPTASDKAIDADMILAAQAITMGERALVVATTNVGHLAHFVRAALWIDITM